MRRIRTAWGTSVRARLAVTYAATLALALSLFATATGIHLSRSSLARVDASLAETMQLLQHLLDEEAAEHATAGHAATEAATDMRSADRRVLIYDAASQLLAVSDSSPLSQAVPLGSLRTLNAPPLASLVSGAASRQITEPQTIDSDNASVRGLAKVTRYQGDTIVIVVLRGLATEEEASETFLAWMIAAIPIALAFAGAGGYLLARASLAPALALAEQAERIGASSLDARLSVANADDELGRLAGVLNALLARLQAAFGQQRTFMADASHELRTPIAVVRTAADVALATPDVSSSTMRETLRTIGVESVRMTRIVNDMFLLARADSVALPVERSLVFLEEIVTEAARAGRLLGGDLGVSVTADADVEAPFVGDAALLGRLVLNLVDNAVQFSPAGATVRLTLGVSSTPQLPGGTQLQGDWYVVAVHDDGPGVDVAIRATLFERFVRSTSSQQRDGRRANNGAGLGLAIARWVTDAHGGHIWHDASTSHGTRFVVLLPTPTQSTASAHSDDGRAIPSSIRGYGRRVESVEALRSRAS